MDSATIREQLRRRPFAPLRIWLSDGSGFDVRHPDQVVLLGRSLIVGLARSPLQPASRTLVVAILHITRLETSTN